MVPRAGILFPRGGFTLLFDPTELRVPVEDFEPMPGSLKAARQMAQKLAKEVQRVPRREGSGEWV